MNTDWRLTDIYTPNEMDAEEIKVPAKSMSHWLARISGKIQRPINDKKTSRQEPFACDPICRADAQNVNGGNEGTPCEPAEKMTEK